MPPSNRDYMVLMGTDPDGNVKEVAIDEDGALKMSVSTTIDSVTDLQDELDGKQDQDALLDAIAAVSPTTKGTILVWDGTAVALLPPGTNGQVLKANSATSTGLEWGTDT